MTILKRGMKNDEVRRLQALLTLAGFDAKPIDGDFGTGTARVVRECQAALGEAKTGNADLAVQAYIGMNKPDSTRSAQPVLANLATDVVAAMFSTHTPRSNIDKYLPAIKSTLLGEAMDDRDLVLMALATIRAESERFEPVDEGISRFNTSGDGEPFDLYDHKLGNDLSGDGAKFKGRGFVQLTGRDNYQRMSARLQIGSQLVEQPEKANEPDIAARVLAAFIADKRSAIKYALLGRDLAYARRLVNGGSHGLQRFTSAFEAGERLLLPLDSPAPEVVANAARLTPVELHVDRFVSDDDTTLSRISVDGRFICFGLEDEYQERKVPKETRIPAGSYDINLRTHGGFHERYRQRFADIHRGMLQISAVEDFTDILIHCGNTDEDTEGCLLVGMDAQTSAGDMSIGRSRAAYRKLYPLLAHAAEVGNLRVRVEDNDRV